MECNETLINHVGDDPTVDKTYGRTMFSDIIIAILNSRLLVIKWRSLGNSRSRQEITSIYPLRMVRAVLIIIIITNRHAVVSILTRPRATQLKCPVSVPDRAQRVFVSSKRPHRRQCTPCFLFSVYRRSSPG